MTCWWIPGDSIKFVSCLHHELDPHARSACFTTENQKLNYWSHKMSEQRKVDCVKLGKSLPGLRRPPYKDDLGKRIYNNVSDEAWKVWLEQQKSKLW